MILIKSDHPHFDQYAGQWAMIVQETELNIMKGGLPAIVQCFDILFMDGQTDTWPQVDPPANYEFMEVEDEFDYPLDNKGRL